MARKKKLPSPFESRCSIAAMSAWDEGTTWDGLPAVEFPWDGNAEMEAASGRGGPC